MSKGSKALGVITGRMGSDIITRTTNNDKKVGTFRLATVDGFGDNELTSWFDIVLFDQKKIEIMERYTGKGSRVMAIGTLRVRKWQDKDGKDRYTTELVVSYDGSIELMDSKDEAQKLGNVRDDKPKAKEAAFDTDLDDDVPF